MVQGTGITAYRQHSTIVITECTAIDKQLLVDVHHKHIFLDNLINLLILCLDSKLNTIVLYIAGVWLIVGCQLIVWLPLSGCEVVVAHTYLNLSLSAQIYSADNCGDHYYFSHNLYYFLLTVQR